MLYAILAHDSDFGIGKANGLPWPRLKADMARFREITMSTTVIMGRKTWESLPGRLEGRTCRVVTSRPLSGVEAFPSFEAAAYDCGERLTVAIGGSAIYEAAFKHPLFTAAFVTQVEGSFGCDTWVTMRGLATYWGDWQREGQTRFRFGTATRVKLWNT